jgi:hypothetical protein
MLRVCVFLSAEVAVHKQVLPLLIGAETEKALVGASKESKRMLEEERTDRARSIRERYSS